MCRSCGKKETNMAVARERFALGLTYEEFKARMTRNQERFAANERDVRLDPADVAAFAALPRPVHVLVLAEDWCGDVIDNLPVLGRAAQESGKLDLRVFLRDENLDLIDQYLKQGQFRSIPVFAFFDDEFRPLGHFTERPDSVTARRLQRRRDLYDQHPEFGALGTPADQLPEAVRADLSQALTALREETKPQDNQDVVRELRAIIERAPVA
jgi:hypothetical protein